MTLLLITNRHFQTTHCCAATFLFSSKSVKYLVMVIPSCVVTDASHVANKANRTMHVRAPDGVLRLTVMFKKKIIWPPPIRHRHKTFLFGGVTETERRQDGSNWRSPD